MAIGDCVRVIVGVWERLIVTDTDLVNGYVVAIGLGDLEYVGETVYDVDGVIDLVKGNVVGIPVIDTV